MPRTTRHIPESRTLCGRKLSPAQTRVVRYLLRHQFIECPNELSDLHIQQRTLEHMARFDALTVGLSFSGLGAWYRLSPGALLELARFGAEFGEF